MTAIDRRAFIALAAAGAAAGVLNPARAHPRRAPRRLPDTFFSWTQVREGVHAATDLSLGGNVMVVASGGQTLLIDTKFPAFARALARESEALGGPVSKVINTHHHGDHTGGNAILAAQAGIIAHPRAAERIAGQLERYAAAARGGPGQVDRERPGAEEVLAEAQAAAEASGTWTAEQFAPAESVSSWPHDLRFGEAGVVLRHFGAGHTDNDLVVHLPSANVIHTGDLVFHGLHPFFDPDGGATCLGWIDSVSRVIELCDAETVVVPGHGGVTNREGLLSQKRYLSELWDRVGKEVRKGAARDDVTAMRWDFMDGLGFEQVRSRAIGAVFDEITGGRQ